MTNKPDYKHREIKFRGRDKKTKKIRHVIEVWFDDWWVLLEWVVQREAKDVILLQRTWVRDKNGVDIYEGDVVSYFDQWPYPIQFGKCSINWWEYACFWYYIDKKPKEILTPFDTDYLIVVGNIFESPDLLTKTDDD